MSLRQKGFCQSVQGVCENPKTYTINGSFGEVVATLEWVAQGARIFGHHGHHGLHPFQVWLAEDQRFANDINFADFAQFRSQFNSDEDAIKEFARLFSEFSKTLPETEDEISLNLTLSESLLLKELLLDTEANANADSEDSRQVFAGIRKTLDVELHNLAIAKDIYE